MTNLQLNQKDFARFATRGRKASVTGLSEVIRYLRRYQPETLKEIRKDMRTNIEPIVAPLVQQVNTQITSQLQSRDYEMFHNGRTQWNGVRYTPKVSSNRKGIIKLTFTGKGGKLGYDYAELAGIGRRPPRSQSKGWYSSSPGYHSYDYAGQGQVFNERLERDFGKPGRFMWIRIIKRRNLINFVVQEILEKYNIRLNAKLRGGQGRPGGFI